MTAAAIERETDHDGRERRCIVTGEVLPEAALVRFVEGPEGMIVPDIAAKLPGRGMWIRADRQILEKAVAKNYFSRAARKALKPPADLVARVEALLVQRMASDLGLARRAGALVLGFERISEALAGKSPPSMLVEASDGAKDGRRKLLGVASAQGRSPKVLDCLNSQELSLALGRENVVHAALKSGQLAERLDRNARRLAAIRAPETNKTKAGPTPAARRYE